MTRASRPALAGGSSPWGGGKNCGPSTLMSGNTSSNHEPEGCRGLTPGYWKTHPDKSGDYFLVGPCNPISSDQWSTCDDYSVPTEFELTERSEEHTSELQSLMRISYAVFCLKKKKQKKNTVNIP